MPRWRWLLAAAIVPVLLGGPDATTLVLAFIPLALAVNAPVGVVTTCSVACTLVAVLVEFAISDPWEAATRIILVVGCGGYAVAVARYRTAVEYRSNAVLQAAQLAEAGRLAGAFAHDVSNLLSVVAWSAAQLTAAVDPSGHDDLATLRSAADSAIEMARRYLRSTSDVDDDQHCDPALVVGRVVVLIGRTAAREHRVVMEHDGELGTVPAAAIGSGALERILVNLAINGCDAMRDQPGRLSFSLRPAPAPDDSSRPWVAITVADTGCGMDPATLERATTPFFTTKSGSGTGLGLHLVTTLVDEVGGRFEITSTPGVGTSATVVIPAADNAPVEERR